MSARFQRWVDTWIEDNIVPGANSDIETNEARAARMTARLFTEAAEAGFPKAEIEAVRSKVPGLVVAAVSASTDFDIDAYHLQWQLAQEHEDGD